MYYCEACDAEGEQPATSDDLEATGESDMSPGRFSFTT